MIKDSGDRTEFETGAKRDMHAGKGRMDLLPWYGIMEVSKHCEEGALKYGEHNVDKIQCRHCGFGCDNAGSVIVQYDEETMSPIADDHGLRKLIRDWDSILRDPERERIANI